MRHIRDFVEINKNEKIILNHYKFNHCPDSTKSEFLLGTAISGIRMPHVTIELRPIDYVNHKIQNWIRDIIMTHMSPEATIVIIIKP